MNAPGVKARAVWPWEAEPYKLWSLWDMANAFAAANFSSALTNLERALAFAEIAMQQGGVGPQFAIQAGTLPQYIKAMKAVEKELDDGDVPLSPPTRLLLVRLEAKLEYAQSNPHFYNLSDLTAEVRCLRQVLIDDVTQHFFLCIPYNMRFLYEDPSKQIGERVFDVFPDAKRDAEAMLRCLALSEWTASVLHAMRALEPVLKAFAERYELVWKREQWAVVIDGIESRIREHLKQSAKDSPERARAEKYAVAAVQFRYFKDAWRNHAAHAREHYDDKDADSVSTHVVEFLRLTAELEKPTDRSWLSRVFPFSRWRRR